MRAQIHDGPEHMLQWETEYIEASASATVAPHKSPCTARPDHTLGHSRLSEPVQPTMSCPFRFVLNSNGRWLFSAAARLSVSISASSIR